MNKDKKHIDDFFKEELDNHTEPLTSEELSLFEEPVDTNRKKRLFFINPKYLKWLPYLAGLSAAAAVGYVATPLFNNKTTNTPQTNKTQTIVYKKQEKLLDKIPAKKIDSFFVAPVKATTPTLYKNNTKHRIEVLGLTKINTSPFALFPQAYAKQNLLLNGEEGNRMRSNLEVGLYTPKGMRNTNARDNNIDVTFNLGIETNTKLSTITSTVASLQLRYKVASRLFVGIQPGFKFGNISPIPLPEQLTFYNSPYSDITINGNQNVPNTFDYYYTENYDSIDAKYTLKNSMWDIELPVFWEYAFSKKVSLVAGIEFVYGKLPEIQKVETRYTKTYRDTLTEVPFILPPDNVIVLFQPQCNCISDDETYYQNPSSMKLRTAYTLGVNIRPIDKMLLNISIHQNSSDLSYIPNPDIRNIYNATRLRLSLGYKINSSNK